ncbi:DNA polymerase II [Haliea sp. E1-2-M8]|uniref:DNA polymerase II n=1 Tax=Haliea sp. E1-2-M8 TaxID=3064706 RepID=UPI00271713D4|nr:DNA polymerase II [Haliea sp. E1-2-M8]MDO8863864.1 DNA polymerase II [Haliea sp. E1-2-M8]
MPSAPVRNPPSGVQREGFLLTRQWRDTAAGIELELWFATAQGPLQVIIGGERSVFFLAADEAEQQRGLLALHAGVEVAPVALRNFTMQPVVAVYSRSYRQARQLADQLSARGAEPLEADINPADRFLMERFIAGGACIAGVPVVSGNFTRMSDAALRPASLRPALKMVSFDIETAMEGLQLYSIAVHATGPDGDYRQVFMLGENVAGRGVAGEHMVALPSQQAVLEAFLQFVASHDPDVLVGWNVVNFDTWYLQRLADSLGVALWLGRARAPVQWRELDDDGERRTARVPGRLLLDGIELLRAAFYRFESFSLEAVSRELLGEGKLLHGSDRGEEIGRLFREDKPRLAAYNLRDCELVSRIFAETRLLDFALARSVMTGLNPDRLGGSVASFDNLYLPRLHRAGFVAPNASADHSGSPGGFVLDSQPGLYDHVLVLDFKSLYPSIIRTFAIDPLGLALALHGDLAEGATVPGFAGASFARSGHILPALITSLWQQRDVAKAAADAPLSQAIKIIMNSFYGVLGSPGCRFFDARLASSITRRGHEILLRTRERIEASGHRVIYGDTDSVFVWIAEAGSDAEAEQAGRILQAELNSWWQEHLQREFGLVSALELEFETHYRRFLMPTIRGSEKGSKKRYAGLVGSGEAQRLVFKGLESVRSDWTRLARDFQEELYRRIFLDEPWDDYVRQVTIGLLAGRHDSGLVYRKRLRRRLDDYQRNVPPHVQAARRYPEQGLPLPRRGDWVEYVITAVGAEPAVAPRAPLDYEHYVERQLEPVADGILGLLGTSFSAVTGRQIDLF